MIVTETYHHGVETSTVKGAGSTDEALSNLELILEIGLLLGGTTAVGGAVVEALVSGQSRGDGGGKSHQTRLGVHVVVLSEGEFTTYRT